MLPSIALTAIVSILQEFVCELHHGALILASVNAFIAFLLGVINFMKLDAKSEAHKISSHQYDKLQHNRAGPTRHGHAKTEISNTTQTGTY